MSVIPTRCFEFHLEAPLPLTAAALRSGAPAPLSTTGPNIQLVGDSISMGSSGYSLFVQDMMQDTSSGSKPPGLV